MTSKRKQDLIDAQHAGEMKASLLWALELLEDEETADAVRKIMTVIKMLTDDESGSISNL